MSSYKDKIVWITGASSGIGEALALAFAKEGARLVLSARREDELQRVKKACGLNDSSCMILPLDLEHTENVNQLCDTVIKQFGRIDVLINNGGFSQRSFVKDTPMAIDRKIMEVNFFGTIALTKAVLPQMLKQKSGQIVAMSSVSGKFGFYLRSAYSASKHALHGYFESLRMEVHKDNIDVLIVCPGRIKTNISINAITKEGKQHGVMDAPQEAGLPADECARQVIAALKNKEEEIYIGQSREKRALWLKRMFPKWFSKMIRKQKIE